MKTPAILFAALAIASAGSLKADGYYLNPDGTRDYDREIAEQKQQEESERLESDKRQLEYNNRQLEDRIDELEKAERNRVWKELWDQNFR